MGEMTREQFVELVYAVIQENYGENCIDAMAFPGILKFIHDSAEFIHMSVRLHAQDLDLDTIKNCKYVTYYDIRGNFLTFEIPKEEAEKILDADPLATVAVNNAAIKYKIAVQTDYDSNGSIYFDGEDPDGEYILPYICEASDVFETKLFTDGDVISDELLPDFDQTYKYNRELEIENSTYTILVDERRGRPTGLAIRGVTVGNCQWMVDEAVKLQKGFTTGYKVVIGDKPSVYKLYKN